MKSKVKLIVGLGNPGIAYKRTRHNAGAQVVEKLAKDKNISFKLNRSFNGLLANGVVGDKPFILFLPQTFMNLSGEAVLYLAWKKHIACADMMVVYDDVALPLGEIRIRASGSDGGHNGLASVIERLGKKDFARLRLGIAGAEKYDDLANYVLAKFTKDEEPIVKEIEEKGVAAIEMWIEKGLEPTMNRFNPLRKI